MRGRGPALLMVGALLGGLVACTAPADTADPDPLIILSGRDQSRGGQRGLLIDSWNEMHPDREARIVELSPIADAQRSEMVARAQADAKVDIYNLDVTWTAEFAAAGYIQSLDETQVSTEGFLDGPLQTCRYDDRLWALPFNTDVGLLYYNKQLLGPDDPPREWATLITQARRAQQAGAAGYLGQYGDYEGLTVTALELIWGAGGDVIDESDRVLPDPAAFRNGLNRLQSISPPDLPPFGETETTQAFREGKALFMRNWPVAYEDLRANPENPPPDFGVIPLPERSAALGGQNLAIAADTDRADDARELIEFLTGERSQTLLYTRGGLPATRRIVYDDPALPGTELPPLTATLREALDNARNRPALPHYATFSQALRAIADDALRGGELPPDEELRERLNAARLGRVPAG